MAYHVYLERSQDPSPEGVQRLARSVAERFGVEVEVIARRLAGGRFAARTNVDRERATRFAAELERLGAVCTVVEDSGEKVEAPPTERAAAPAAQAENTGTPGPEYASGLAAAFSSSDGAPSLGALEGLESETASGSLRLSTLDGTEDEGPAPPSPEAFEPASSGEPDPEIAEPPAPAGGWAAADPFAPPPDEGGKLELDVDLPSAGPAAEPASAPESAAPEPVAAAKAFVSRPQASEPGAAPPPGASRPPVRRPSALPQRAVPSTGWRRAADRASEVFERGRAELSIRPRVRFAAGVLLAILLGFLPAHMISAAREGSAYEGVKQELRLEYAELTEPEDWEVEELQTTALEEMKSRRLNIALTGCLVWAAAGGGLAFLWFRRIDWGPDA